MNHKNSKQSNKSKPKFGKTIVNDFRQGNLRKSFYKDIKDLYHFYLDEEDRIRLRKMTRVKRWFSMVSWVFKSMFFKLTPIRRILLIVGIVLSFWQYGSTNKSGANDNMVFGFLILLLIIILELKDKLLAQDELAVGRAVQNALMPQQIPSISGWDIWMYSSPANDVGGDLVDYLMIDDERHCLSLGDVAGKGLGAALLMAKLQATIKAIAENFESLAKFGSQLNHIFCRDGLPDRFISLIHFELQPNSDAIRFLNAGHMPPIKLHDSAMEELEKGSPALGIHSKSSFHEQSVNLKQDDVLFIYSDGLTECRNEEGDFFGEQRLFALLPKLTQFSSRQIGEKMLSQVKFFAGEARPSDDLSLIILKRKK